MNSENGKKNWIFPDAELPPAGTSPLKGHESIVVLNLNKDNVEILMTLYFADKKPLELKPVVIEGERVRCIRLDESKDVGVEIDREKQYAIKLRSALPVVVQYGRLDSRQDNLAYYTTMGYTY